MTASSRLTILLLLFVAACGVASDPYELVVVQRGDTIFREQGRRCFVSSSGRNAYVRKDWRRLVDISVPNDALAVCR